MLVIMQANADETAIQNVVNLIHQQGLQEHISRGKEHTIIGAVGDERVFNPTEIERLPQVEKAIRVMNDWRIISREAWAEDTIITIRGKQFGGKHPQIIAYQSHYHTSTLLSNNQHTVLLDPFYITDNPYTANQYNSEASIAQQLQHIITQHHQNNQIVAIRVRDSRHIQAALNAQADLIYLGGELLSNRYILHETGNLNIPVIICKDTHHSVRDWLVAAEQIVLKGNQHIILGEAGTLHLHNTTPRLDVDAIAAAKQLSHLPILANISGLSHRYMNQNTLLQLAQAAGANIIVVER